MQLLWESIRIPSIEGCSTHSNLSSVRTHVINLWNDPPSLPFSFFVTLKLCSCQWTKTKLEFELVIFFLLICAWIWQLLASLHDFVFTSSSTYTELNLKFSVNGFGTQWGCDLSYLLARWKICNTMRVCDLSYLLARWNICNTMRLKDGPFESEFLFFYMIFILLSSSLFLLKWLEIVMGF